MSLPPELVDEVDAYAEEQGIRSRSRAVEIFLKEGLEDDDQVDTDAVVEELTEELDERDDQATLTERLATRDALVGFGSVLAAGVLTVLLAYVFLSTLGAQGSTAVASVGALLTAAGTLGVSASIGARHAPAGGGVLAGASDARTMRLLAAIAGVALAVVLAGLELAAGSGVIRAVGVANAAAGTIVLGAVTAVVVAIAVSETVDLVLYAGGGDP